MKKSPFVKGAYFIERGVALEETEDDEYEGSSLRQRAAALLLAQSKCSLSGL